VALNELTACDVIQRVRSGETSSVEVTQSVLDRIESAEPTLNAFVSVDVERALARAESIDNRRSRGEELGGLAGVPIAVKDVICVRGGRTTCGSRIL
ncbi:uncharacterized protein METZ01_LOCUS475127, partial [marine metagenome]